MLNASANKPRLGSVRAKVLTRRYGRMTSDKECSSNSSWLFPLQASSSCSVRRRCDDYRDKLFMMCIGHANLGASRESATVRTKRERCNKVMGLSDAICWGWRIPIQREISALKKTRLYKDRVRDANPVSGPGSQCEGDSSRDYARIETRTSRTSPIPCQPGGAGYYTIGDDSRGRCDVLFQ
jgi:hypothetical protein